MRTPSRTLTVATAATIAVAFAAPAMAVTGGAPDGNAHPNVGLLLYSGGDGLYSCTGTLISPTVVLTAAHCTDGIVGDVIVSFDSEIADADDRGKDWIPGYDGTNYDALAAAGFDYNGTFTDKGHTWTSGAAHTAPNYSNFTDLDTWNDYGVVVLEAPVDIAPAELAPVGYLDTIPKSKLSKTIFTTVGYGTEVRKPDAGPQKPQPMSYPILRRVAEEPGQKRTDQIIQVNGNINDTRGTGGTCFGDSGGPSFLNGYLVTVTSYGYTDNCRYIGGLQRVDIAEAQDWILSFVE
jgi:secreted trypsin-like serine protease